MTTAGIDLASQPSKTAMARLEWEAGSARVVSLVLGADDDVLLEALSRADQVAGIDCPFGWPEKFVEMVSAHAAGTLAMEPDPPADWKRDFVLRATDIDVHDRTGVTPLSVAADRIGHTAIRLAAVLSRLDADVPAGLDGSGAIAEVYPAAALKTWGLPFRGYKGAANAEARVELVEALTETAPWLDLADHDALCRASDDALDAVICALVARCVQVGATEPPSDRETARREGWIHLPTASLAELATLG